MKKLYLSVFGLFTVAAVSAQLSAGAHLNYTMYKGDFKKSTPGVGARISYNFTPKVTTLLGVTAGFPIKDPSAVTLMDGSGGTKTVQSEFKYNFTTIQLLGQYAFVGDEETAGKFYGMAGASYVMAAYKEAIKEDYDKNVYQPVGMYEKGKEQGFTLNLGLGGEYSLGAEGMGPRVFGEAGLAFPANQQNGTYVENNIPAHFMFNLGVKFSFGASGY